MRIAGLTKRRTSAVVPIAVKRPSSIASASAYGCAGSAVKILALTRTRAGAGVSSDLAVGTVAPRLHTVESVANGTIIQRTARPL